MQSHVSNTKMPSLFCMCARMWGVNVTWWPYDWCSLWTRAAYIVPPPGHKYLLWNDYHTHQEHQSTVFAKITQQGFVATCNLIGHIYICHQDHAGDGGGGVCAWGAAVMNHLTRSVSEQTGLFADVAIWGNPGNIRETSHPRSLCLLSQSRIRLGVWPHSGERFVISESVLSCQLSNSGSGLSPFQTQGSEPRLHPGLTITPFWTHHDFILDLPILHPGLTNDSILDSPRLHLELTKTPCLIHQWMNTPHKVVHWRLLKLRLQWLHNFSWSLMFPLV